MSPEEAVEVALGDSGLDLMADPADIIAALRAVRYVLVELPKPQPKSELYDMHFDVQSVDTFMSGPRTPRVCVDTATGELYQVCTPTAHITPVEARSLAAALLAAADAAEATHA